MQHRQGTHTHTLTHHVHPAAIVDITAVSEPSPAVLCPIPLLSLCLARPVHACLALIPCCALLLPQGALLLLLFRVSHQLEDRLTEKAAGSLQRLFDSVPDSAVVVEVEAGSGAPKVATSQEV